MMIGELDYTSIFLDEELHYNVISHNFFYIFMLFMMIVGVNLMVGLAVDNIQEFQKDAGLAKKEMQVRFALELDSLSVSWIFSKISSALHCDRNENDRETHPRGDERENDNFVEILQPSKQNWLQKKIGKSWKLTEKDIKAALASGTDETAKEIRELKKKMRDMQEEMKSLNSKLTTIIQNLK